MLEKADRSREHRQDFAYGRRYAIGAILYVSPALIAFCFVVRYILVGGPRLARLSSGGFSRWPARGTGYTIIAVPSAAKGLPHLLLSGLPLAPLDVTTVQRATLNGIRAFVSRTLVPTSGGYVLGRDLPDPADADRSARTSVSLECTGGTPCPNDAFGESVAAALTITQMKSRVA
jgi:hypothetical protein